MHHRLAVLMHCSVPAVRDKIASSSVIEDSGRDSLPSSALSILNISFHCAECHGAESTIFHPTHLHHLVEGVLHYVCRYTVDIRILTVSGCWCQEAIIRNDFDGPNPDGSYKWALQTEGGIYHEQRGSLQPTAEGPALVVEGQYQYTAPDGQVINVLYKADENGYQPIGEHLPTPPPIPPAIQRALDYLASLPPNRDYQ